MASKGSFDQSGLGASFAGLCGSSVFYSLSLSAPPFSILMPLGF